MVNLTRIYTKTGDDGTTSLGDMSRTSKNDPRLEAYATVDEANSAIGVVLALGGIKDDEITKLLVRIQNDLFDVGADLCTPIVDNPTIEPLRVLESQIDYLRSKLINTMSLYNHFVHLYFHLEPPHQHYYMSQELWLGVLSEILGMLFIHLAAG